MSEDEARYLLRQILSVLCYLLLKLDGHHSVLLVRSFAVQGFDAYDYSTHGMPKSY